MRSSPNHRLLPNQANLTSPHLRQLAEEGYCVINGIFTPGEIDSIRAFFEDYKNIGSAVAWSYVRSIGPTP